MNTKAYHVYLSYLVYRVKSFASVERGQLTGLGGMYDKWTSQGLAEVDFLISKEQHIFPLEVKADFSQKKKSLLVYEEKFSQGENSPSVFF